MSSQIANISLYIPHVFVNISKRTVADTFEDLRIGNVKRVDFVCKRGPNGDFNAVYIHFNHWYDNVAAHNFQERVINPSMEARIVYDEPWYWIVLENKTYGTLRTPYTYGNKKVSERKPRVNLEALCNTAYVTPTKQMTNQDFANLLKAPQVLAQSSLEEDDADFRALCRDISSELCYAQEEAAIITLDEIIDENKKLTEKLGVYMEKADRLEHEFNMLMDDKISLQNELALLKENQVYHNL